MQNNAAKSLMMLSRNPEISVSNLEISATDLKELEPVNEEQISFFNELGLSRLDVSNKSHSSNNELLENRRTRDTHPAKEYLYDLEQSTNFRVPVKFFVEKPLPDHDSIFDPLLSPLTEKLSCHESLQAKNAQSVVIMEPNKGKAVVRCSKHAKSFVPNLQENATNEGGLEISTTVSTSSLLNRRKNKPKLNPSKIKAPCNSTSNSTPMNVSESSTTQVSSSEIHSNTDRASNQNGHNYKQSSSKNLCCPIHTQRNASQTEIGAGSSHEKPLKSDHFICDDRISHDFENHLSDCPKSPSKFLYKKLYIKLPSKTNSMQKNITDCYVPPLTQRGDTNLEKNTSLPKEGSSETAVVSVSSCDGVQPVEFPVKTFSRGKKIHMVQTLVGSSQGEDPINLIKASNDESIVVSPRENLVSVSSNISQNNERPIELSFKLEDVPGNPQKDKALRVLNKFVRLKSNHEIVKTAKTDASSPTDENTEMSQSSEIHDVPEVTSDHHDGMKASDENMPSCATETSLLEISADEKFDCAESSIVKANGELNCGKQPSTSRPPQFVDSNGIVWGLVEIHNGDYPLRVLKPIKIPDNGKVVNLGQEIISNYEPGAKKRKSETPKKKVSTLISVTPEKKMKMNNTAFRTNISCTFKPGTAEIGNGKLSKDKFVCSKITNPTHSIPLSDKESKCNSSSSCLQNLQCPEGDLNNSSSGLDDICSKNVSDACVSKERSLIKSNCLELVPFSAITTPVLSKEIAVHSGCTCIVSNGTERNGIFPSTLDTKTWEIDLQCKNSTKSVVLLDNTTDFSHMCQSSEQNSCCSLNTSCIKPSEKQYFCDFCCKEYSRKSHLIRHHRIHVDDRPFQCGTCHKKFTTKAILKQHERLHSGERPFSCTVCDKTFTQKSSLLTHTMLHSGKPFKCFFCRFAVVSNHKLQRHLRRHEIGDSGLFCCACDYRFSTEGAFREHLAEAHNYPPEFKIGKIGGRIEEGTKIKRKIRSKQLLVT